MKYALWDLHNISLSKKLAVSAAIFLFPLVLLVYFLITEKDDLIDFTRREIVGVHDMRPVLSFVEVMVSTDSTEENLQKAVATLQQAEPSDAILGTTEKRAAFVAALEPVVKGGDSKEALAKAIDLISTISDNSNITLDPDMDAYFVGDLVVTHVTQILRQLNNLITAAHALDNAAEKTDALKIAYAEARDGVVSSANGLATDMGKAIKGNADGSVQLALEEDGVALATSVAELGAASETNDRQALLAAANEVARQTGVISDNSTDIMEYLLNRRINGFYSVLYTRLAIALFSIVLGVFVSWCGVRSITRPLKLITNLMGHLTTDDLNIQRTDSRENKNPSALSIGNLAAVIPLQIRQDEIGELARAVQVFRDKSLYIVKAEQARVAAEHANFLKSDFLARMSHEIRTPLNGVIATAELLSETTLDDSQNKYVDTIKSSGGLLLSLVNEVLDLSKIEAGKIELHPEPVELRSFCEKALALYAAQASKKKLQFNSTVADELPSWVSLDSARMGQLIANLVSNAIKYTEQGQVRVRFCLALREGKKFIRCQVEDSGRGIPSEHKSRVFDKFVQVHHTSSAGGTGLGLAICQSLVGVMGGNIGVESEEGNGSVFWFEVPCVDARPVDMKVPEAPENFNVSSKHRILLVDDVETNRFVFGAMLKSSGCQVDFAVNGQEAVDKVLAHSYDLVFMDCSMPVMDGFEATRRIKSGCAAPPSIIALTAHALEAEVKKCHAAGMDDFLTKPIQKAALVKTVNRWITA